MAEGAEQDSPKQTQTGGQQAKYQYTVTASSPNTSSSKEAHEVKQIIAQSHEGMLPAPWTLEGYSQVPDALETVLAMAQREQEHRHEREREEQEHWHRMNEKHLTSSTHLAGAGMAVAAVITIAIALLGTFLIYHDKDGLGFSLIIAELVGVAGLFIYSRRSEGESEEGGKASNTEGAT